MAKTGKKVRRVDSIEDHVHELPGGGVTGGMLRKPSKDTFEMHTHLYEQEEDTVECGPMHNFGDHTHKVGDEMTSGPRPVPKLPGEPWQKMDSLSREGSVWVVRSSTGNTLARSENKAELKKAFPDAAE